MMVSIRWLKCCFLWSWFYLSTREGTYIYLHVKLPVLDTWSLSRFLCSVVLMILDWGDGHIVVNLLNALHDIFKSAYELLSVDLVMRRFRCFTPWWSYSTFKGCIYARPYFDILMSWIVLRLIVSYHSYILRFPKSCVDRIPLLLKSMLQMKVWRFDLKLVTSALLHHVKDCVLFPGKEKTPESDRCWRPFIPYPDHHLSTITISAPQPLSLPHTKQIPLSGPGSVRGRRNEADPARTAAVLRETEGEREEQETVWSAGSAGV